MDELEEAQAQSERDMEYNKKKSEQVMKSNAAYEEEIVRMQQERDQFIYRMQEIKAEFDLSSQDAMDETMKLRDINSQLKQENCRLTLEKSDKDHLIKELTAKNLELLAKIATVESGFKPLHEDLKAQLEDYKIRIEKSDGYFLSLERCQE